MIGFEVYRAWRASTLGAVTEAIEQRLILELMGELKGSSVLDVGCGDGALACAAASRGAQMSGVDPDPAMLDAARRRAEQAGVKMDFREGRIEQLPFADASFDVVTAVTVLCFVADARGAMREMARVLRPGGRLVLGELGRWSPWAAIRRLRGWLGAKTWKTARFRTAGELRALAEQAGLSVTAIRGAVFYPPLGLCGRLVAPLDPWLGRHTTMGAAFIALKATRPRDHGGREA
ncbi:MAG: class I SAM-dependent methyltransferase [Alphaproteobacteria bacterium]|nr:class I SAM-dependent methyltransferase [Alphaproteobacteria bacterium]